MPNRAAGSSPIEAACRVRWRDTAASSRDRLNAKALGAATAIHAIALAALIGWSSRLDRPTAMFSDAVTVTLVTRAPNATSSGQAAQRREGPFADLLKDASNDGPARAAESSDVGSLDELLGGQTPTAASSEAEGGDFDPYARAATSFRDNVPADLRKLVVRCWRRPAGAKVVRVHFALNRDGDVRDVIILDEELGATPEVVKATAARAIRDCGPYPPARGAHEYIVDLK